MLKREPWGLAQPGHSAMTSAVMQAPLTVSEAPIKPYSSCLNHEQITKDPWTDNKDAWDVWGKSQTWKLEIKTHEQRRGRGEARVWKKQWLYRLNFLPTSPPALLLPSKNINRKTVSIIPERRKFRIIKVRTGCFKREYSETAATNPPKTLAVKNNHKNKDSVESEKIKFK